MSRVTTIDEIAQEDRLPRLLDFIEQACREAQIDEEASFAVRLAAEELVINVIRHGYEGLAPGPIHLALERTPDEVVLTIADKAPPFDPREAPQPDLSLPAEHRPIGGLGWHLVKQFMDRIDYTNDPVAGNRTVLVKKLATPGAPPASAQT